MRIAIFERMKTVIFALMLLFLAGPVFGQGYDKTRGRPGAQAKEGAVALQLETFAVGVGSFFAEESVTFSADALFVPIQFHAVGLPFIKQGTSTGVAIEFHPTSVTFGPGGNLRFSQLDYRLWSVTRIPISAIPIRALNTGTPSRLFAGTDILLDEGGPDDYTGGFEARMVVGGDLGIVWKGNMVVEIYMFQQNVPISFALFWGF